MNYGTSPINSVKGNIRIVKLLFVLFLFLLPALSSAEDRDSDRAIALSKDSGNIRLGPLDMHPYGTFKETYSDNIFLVRDDKKADFVTSFTPGLLLQLPFRQHTLSFNINTTLTRYAKYSSENTTDYSAAGQANFVFGSRINLKLADTFINGHESRSESSIGEIEKFRKNEATASLTYLLAEVSKVQVDYTRTAWDFTKSEFRSRDEDLVSAYVYYRMLPKTSVFIEYDFKNVKFDKSNGLDNKVNTGQLGLTWNFTESSKGTVKGGYLWKKFDQSSNGNVNTWIASIDLNHDFSDYNSVRLVGSRTVDETSLLDTRYAVVTGLYGEYTHKFVDRLSGVIKGSYAMEKYSDISSGDTVLRKDKVALGGAGLRYIFSRWLELGLEYNYRKKKSNIDTFNYTENSVILTVYSSL